MRTPAVKMDVLFQTERRQSTGSSECLHSLASFVTGDSMAHFHHFARDIGPQYGGVYIDMGSGLLNLPVDIVQSRPVDLDQQLTRTRGGDLTLAYDELTLL